MARVGRPLKYKTVEEIKPLIDRFFEETPKTEWTITGLALALDTSRQTLLEYEGEVKGLEKPKEFIDVIKKAKVMVEHSYEIDLKKHGRTGTIFALKNMGEPWRDKTEQEITGDGLKTIIINKSGNNDKSIS